MAGPWGDLSPHLHMLLKLFAESRMEAIGRAQGWEVGPGILGKVMGEVRRAASVMVVRSQVLCLLDNVRSRFMSCSKTWLCLGHWFLCHREERVTS